MLKLVEDRNDATSQILKDYYKLHFTAYLLQNIEEMSPAVALCSSTYFCCAKLSHRSQDDITMGKMSKSERAIADKDPSSVDSTTSSDVNDIRPEEGSSEAISRLKMNATRLKQKGNESFARKQYQSALEFYRTGLDCATRAKQLSRKEEDQENDEEIFDLEIALESNISLTLFRLNQYYMSEIHVTRAIEAVRSQQEHQTQNSSSTSTAGYERHQHAKLLYRRAMTLQQLHKYHEAR